MASVNSSHHLHSSHHINAVKAAWISIIVTLVLVAFKVTAGLLSGSLALLSLASESALDLFSVLLSLVAVNIAYLPADEDHQYGHGKFDSLMSLFQCIALLGVSIWIFIEAVTRLQEPTHKPLVIDFFTFLVLIGSFLLDSWRSYKLHSAGKAVDSKALQTDAIHFLVDGLGTLIVLIGILLYHYFQIESADTVAAIILSGFVAYLSIRQGKDAVDGLTDRLSSSSEYKQIDELLNKVDGVLSIKNLRMRRSGPALFVEAGLEINRVLPFAGVQQLLLTCEKDIKSMFPNSELNVYPIPIKTHNESIFETVKIISGEFGVLPHNIELAQIEHSGLVLDLHLEFRPQLSLEEAHTLSTKIEQQIAREIPAIKQIVIHLEEERSDESLPKFDKVESTAHIQVEQITTLIKSQFPKVLQVKEVELFRNEDSGELKLTAIVELERTLSLYDAHEISSAIEQAIRNEYSEILRIVIHVEPQAT